MIHASNKKASHRLVETPPRPPRRPPASPPTLRQALELCHFDQSRHVYIEGSETQLSFGESSSFATEIHFYCEPNADPIEPPGHQQGPAQWHGHQVLLSKFNGCVSGEYRIGLDAQRHVIFQREVSPWIVTTTDVIPLHEWHSIVCTYDGHFMRIYIDCRHAAHVACGTNGTLASRRRHGQRGTPSTWPCPLSSYVAPQPTIVAFAPATARLGSPSSRGSAPRAFSAAPHRAGRRSISRHTSARSVS